MFTWRPTNPVESRWFRRVRDPLVTKRITGKRVAMIENTEGGLRDERGRHCSREAPRRPAAPGLRKLVTGKHYVIDTSRNGATPSTDDVINPTWARIGKAPRLVLRGSFDGTLWVKHPGESDGTENGGPSAGQWCDLLADRLLGRSGTGNC